METNMKLAVGRILVTGGGSGMGRGTALELAKAGATVYVMGRAEAPLRETVQLGAVLPGRIIAIPGDIRSEESVEKVFSAIEADGGPAYGLVHAAASPHYKPAQLMTSTEFREVMESILLGTFHVVHRWGTALLKTQHPGRAVVLTSAFASRGTPGAAHSSASKAGQEALVKTLAREWGPSGLALNVVGPGFFPLERTQWLKQKGEVTDRIVQNVALGRFGTLSEAVGPIVFLLSEGAAYITGQVLIPDGGFRLTPWVLPPTRYEYAGDKQQFIRIGAGETVRPVTAGDMGTVLMSDKAAP